ncbi:MAG TPA: hypothetical protein PKU97_00990 [Kofleriaceae bacterium]|nr:hypothetical protein [Kofleriaceae bacterium]
MRIRTLATLFALSLGACTGTLTDDPIEDPGTDPEPNPDPGTGSNANGLTVTLDKSTINTEYFTTHPIKVTLQGTNGFAGNVALAASVVDAAGVVVPGWTVALASASTTLAANGSAEVMATLTIPSASTAAAGTVKIVATSTAATVTVNTAVNTLKQITFNVTQAAGRCVYAPAYGTQAAPVPVLLGTKIRIVNKGPATITIHGNAPIPHQSTAEGDKLAIDAAYEPAIRTASVTPGQWYCHAITGGTASGGSNQNPHVLIMAPPT